MALSPFDLHGQSVNVAFKSAGLMRRGVVYTGARKMKDFEKQKTKQQVCPSCCGKDGWR